MDKAKKMKKGQPGALRRSLRMAMGKAIPAKKSEDVEGKGGKRMAIALKTARKKAGD